MIDCVNEVSSQGVEVVEESICVILYILYITEVSYYFVEKVSVE